jgi:thymidylate kinase
VVSRLDVVAELEAHQQNLVPEEVGAHRVILVLPAPELCRMSGAAIDWGPRALAEQRGGGDGRLVIVMLSSRVDSTLSLLWERRVRELIVFGARDQPGYARAVRYRWPGALEVLEASWLDALFELQEPIRVVAPGVVRVAPGVAAPPDVPCVFAAVEADDDPRRVAAQGPHVWPYAVDRARELGAWSGVVPPAARFGTRRGDELRTRWDAYWTARGHDVVRPAVLGIDPALEADLREPASVPAVARRAQLIAITGIDGSGKSSQVARLGDTLRQRGARVRVLKLYRQGAFLTLANELGARTRRGAALAAFRVSREVKLVDSLRVYRDHLAAAIAACDAVILDRYVETHVAAAESQLGWDLARHPALAPFPPPDLECFLQLDPDLALERRAARGEPASADEHAIGLRGYAEVFARLAAASGALVLDARAPEVDNARSILARVTVTPSGAADAEPPNTAAARVALGAPREVQIGGDAALGAEVFALRAGLAAWCGPVASAIPEAFWLEVYAAQLVLDVLTGAPGPALALWPSAVAAMAGHGELDLLIELEHMLAPLVVVAHYDPRPASYEPAFQALGATERAARRLARDYAAQLERIAAERGWSRASSA